MSLLYLVRNHQPIHPHKPCRVQYCVYVHAYFPLAILNVCDVGNELPKLVRHNNAQGRDEMDSLLGVSLL